MISKQHSSLGYHKKVNGGVKSMVMKDCDMQKEQPRLKKDMNMALFHMLI